MFTQRLWYNSLIKENNIFIFILFSVISLQNILYHKCHILYQQIFFFEGKKNINKK